MASFQAITPRCSSCGEAEESPTLHCGRGRPQLQTTLTSSGKLVYAAVDEETRVLGKEEAEERSKKISLKGVGRKSHDENTGTGLRSGTARFLMGSFPVRPGKCGPQLSKLMKATTCSSLKASLCFLAASSCSSAHTISSVYLPT